jgi:hypothetical protein
MKPDENNAKPPPMVVKCKTLPELFQVVVECRDEAEQRELWERMKEEGKRVRLLVL